MTPVRRGDVFLVALEPTRGREMRQTRPCLVLSPDDLNEALSTILVAPMTTGSKAYPLWVPCKFGGKLGHIVLDQIRAVDRGRLVRRLGPPAGRPTLVAALKTLQEMFAL